ncbi:hypothetical protein L226DRAFT_338330 [Lentinus tigrinus ALCF2SS1-7]|uniref:uncharacterized protein n=1 Tax=Lentinus tigrinus ALCF2SS1-7 TaxID=1328758 RepID=UPI001165ECD0|nr:hypothetical protein L226DRAFT_338330 [Lentinus tigrinus ALCF2SS1-7]
MPDGTLGRRGDVDACEGNLVHASSSGCYKFACDDRGCRQPTHDARQDVKCSWSLRHATPGSVSNPTVWYVAADAKKIQGGRQPSQIRFVEYGDCLFGTDHPRNHSCTCTSVKCPCFADPACPPASSQNQRIRIAVVASDWRRSASVQRVPPPPVARDGSQTRVFRRKRKVYRWKGSEMERSVWRPS